DALADDVDILLCILLEDREHHVLRPERRGVFDLKLFGEAQKFRRGFGLEVLQFDLRHWLWMLSWEARLGLSGNLAGIRMNAKREVGGKPFCLTCLNALRAPGFRSADLLSTPKGSAG